MSCSFARRASSRSAATRAATGTRCARMHCPPVVPCSTSCSDAEIRLGGVDAIVAEDLHKRYKTVQALDGVSFSVREGEVFGLLGPNGAGKSTIVRTLATLTRPDSGRALVAGEDVVRHPT